MEKEGSSLRLKLGMREFKLVRRGISWRGESLTSKLVRRGFKLLRRGSKLVRRGFKLVMRGEVRV
jgi:hypothetical protein